MTTGAARALWEVVGSIFVAVHAGLALDGCRIFVTAMTGRARAVLGFCMHARKLLDLMTGRARGDAGQSLRTVRTVARHAAGADTPVRALLLGAVTVSAHLLGRQPAMRLVTIGARLVAFRRGLLLAAMTAGTRRGLRTGVRFVAAGAAGVPRLDQASLSLMAVGAGHLVGLWMVRQPAVATGTHLMPVIRGDLLDACRVTALTRRKVAQRELELVRLVAVGARGAAMRTVIGLGELVTRAARADVHGFRELGRMRIVAAHALAGLRRMVGMNPLVTHRTGSGRTRSHVVRRMAVGAAAVRRNPAPADHVDLSVAVPARGGSLLLELVRLVTAGARRVSARKQRRCRNDGLLFRVTRDARRERVFGRRMTVLVASRAGLDQGLTA